MQVLIKQEVGMLRVRVEGVSSTRNNTIPTPTERMQEASLEEWRLKQYNSREMRVEGDGSLYVVCFFCFRYYLHILASMWS